MDSTWAIEKYIIYLIVKCGLSVTIHPLEEETLVFSSPLQRFNIHDNSYCTCIKTSRGGHERCVLQQKKVLDRLKECDSSFSGACYAGVFEYVYPLKNESRTVGFISVGGYSCDKGLERMRKVAERNGYSQSELERAYGTLRDVPFDKEEIDTLIIPLCNMLELAYTKQESREGTNRRIDEVVTYIKNNYTTNLRCEDICRTFGFSRSYFSHTFKSEMKKSFKEYLLDIRIENAKRLLKLSELNVTEIALSVGFNDSNYFSNAFKKSTGKSPLAYRKSSRS